MFLIYNEYVNSILFFIFIFVLGTIVGSFINVFIFRRATGMGMGGRSKCASCGHTLRALDLIPVISFLLLGGKCRYCKTKISSIYPLIEIGAGALFFLIGLVNTSILISFSVIPYSMFFIQLVFWSLVFATAVYDLKHLTIPNMWALSLTIIAIIYSAISNYGFGKNFLFSILSGAIFFIFFFLIWLFSRGKWMGLGDAKLAFPLGVFLGISKLFSAWALSFWTGAIIVLIYFSYEQIILAKGKRLSALGRPITMKSEVPFGPFLFLGSFLAFLGLVIPFSGI